MHVRADSKGLFCKKDGFHDAMNINILVYAVIWENKKHDQFDKKHNKTQKIYLIFIKSHLKKYLEKNRFSSVRTFMDILKDSYLWNKSGEALKRAPIYAGCAG